MEILSNIYTHRFNRFMEVSSSWIDATTKKPDAVNNDFYGVANARKNAREDWAYLISFVMTDSIRSGRTQKFYDKVGIIFEFIDYIGNHEERSTVVTTELDIVDPHDGLTSLREAVRNANPVTGTKVTFAASMQGKTIVLDDELLIIPSMGLKPLPFRRRLYRFFGYRL